MSASSAAYSVARSTRHLLEADAVGPLARHLVVRDRLDVQMTPGEAVHVVRLLPTRARTTRAACRAPRREHEARVGKRVLVVLQVLAELFLRRIGEPWRESRERRRAVELIGDARHNDDRAGCSTRGRARSTAKCRRCAPASDRGSVVSVSNAVTSARSISRRASARARPRRAPSRSASRRGLRVVARRVRCSGCASQRRPASSVAARLAIAPCDVGAPPSPLAMSRSQLLNSKRSYSDFSVAASVARDRKIVRRTAAASQSVFTVRSRLPCGSHASASRRLLPTTPPISCACATTLSSEPYCASHFAAVFGPDLGHAGNVVDRIAGERQQIEHLVRAHVELRAHARLVERLVAHRVDHPDARRDELRQVLVRRRDDRVDAGRRGLLRERADDVVGLHALDHQQRPAVRAHEFVQRLDLRGQIVRHRRRGSPCIADTNRRETSCRARRTRRRSSPACRPRPIGATSTAPRAARRSARLCDVRRSGKRVERAVQVRRPVHQTRA